jgi:hypothetical protein
MKDNRKYRYHCKVIDVKNSDFRDETARVHTLEQRINEWLDDNPNIKIISIIRHEYWYVQIIYKEFQQL